MYRDVAICQITKSCQEQIFLVFDLLVLAEFGCVSEVARIRAKPFLQLPSRFGLARQTHRVSGRAVSNLLLKALSPPYCRSVNPQLLFGRESP